MDCPGRVRLLYSSSSSRDGFAGSSYLRFLSYTQLPTETQMFPSFSILENCKKWNPSPSWRWNSIPVGINTAIKQSNSPSSSNIILAAWCFFLLQGRCSDCLGGFPNSIPSGWWCLSCPMFWRFFDKWNVVGRVMDGCPKRASPSFRPDYLQLILQHPVHVSCQLLNLLIICIILFAPNCRPITNSLRFQISTF